MKCKLDKKKYQMRKDKEESFYKEAEPLVKSRNLLF
jgi:hypothetical protein